MRILPLLVAAGVALAGPGLDLTALREPPPASGTGDTRGAERAAGNGPGTCRSRCWPLAPRPRVTRAFAPGAENWDAGHRGADLEGGSGQAVLAPRSGEVVFAGTLVDRGVVSIRLADGRRTTFEPVDPLVARGDRVVAGQQIGRLVPGHPGCTGAACLHWGLLTGPDRYADPLPLVSPRAVLLPLSS